MKWHFRRFLAFFLLLALSWVPLRAAVCSGEGDDTPWDELLDRYEFICRKCLDLRGQKASGKEISASRLLTLMDELEALRTELKGVSDKMPAAARQRFYAIRKMYVTGQIADTRPQRLEAVASPSRRYVSAAGSQGGVACLEQIPLPRRPFDPLRFVAASVAAPELSLGLTAAWWGKRLGAWGAVRSTFSSHAVSYPAYSDGSMEGGRIWASGKAATDRFYATAGPLLRVSRSLAVYAGAGYGFKRLCWEDSEGDWARIEDASGSGLCYELGLMAITGPCAFGLGWLSLPQVSNSIVVSAGICF